MFVNTPNPFLNVPWGKDGNLNSFPVYYTVFVLCTVHVKIRKVKVILSNHGQLHTLCKWYSINMHGTAVKFARISKKIEILQKLEFYF